MRAIYISVPGFSMPGNSVFPALEFIALGAQRWCLGNPQGRGPRGVRSINSGGRRERCNDSYKGTVKRGRSCLAVIWRCRDISCSRWSTGASNIIAKHKRRDRLNPRISIAMRLHFRQIFWGPKTRLLRSQHHPSRLSPPQDMGKDTDQPKPGPPTLRDI